ncbi:right-handed parallel beta-helix repeat-containing protein [Chitinophaga tropicalis]|uniref:DUF1565 domain-containing protein n=1 Tax=Chitinophaga tropicalis TaxID=2683588 RepID=A0A7K1U483_9BACT|nr:right-handed parallel beta-helix repeat-containing protein [Chitinophaga tropicalis]MVT09106.1 DUF1565 domain-containing protein [Chitinophaga tropicalis]
MKNRFPLNCLRHRSLAILIAVSVIGCAKPETLKAAKLTAVGPQAVKTYYVAPTGNDNNDGSVNSPFLTIQRAQTAAIAGDIVYIRGGNYVMSEAQIARTESLYACVTYLNKSGTASARIQYLAYPGEKPVFDFSNVKPAEKRITAFLITGSYITIKGLDVKGVQVTLTGHTQSECFRNEGSNNIYEGLKMHDGKANGFYLTKGGNNLVLNCDAYNNWDDVSEDKKGGNVDGFGCHPNKSGAGYTGNVFRGCRAWFNSDDGFDCINAMEAITFDNCWSFHNGYSPSFVKLANGLGFKIGGFGVTDFSRVPPVIPRHTVKFCLAVENRTAGFYANHHLGGTDWYNNTAYKNPVNYNMLNRSADYTADVPGYGHTLKNNLGYKATSSEIINIDLAKCNVSNNYFQLSNISITDADFASLTASLLTQARNADFTLPVNDFLHLAAGSDLVDKGIDAGLPYSGNSPDLGCFEYKK